MRVERGVYSFGHDRLTQEGRWMAAVLSCGDGAVLSHRSAATAWGLWRPGSPVIEVTVRGSGRHGRRRVTVHRSTRLGREDVTRRNGIPMTTPARTLLDLAEVVGRRQTERALDEAERLGLCTDRQLRSVIDRNPGRLGGARLAAVLDEHALGSTATANDFEELFLALCRESAFPEPEVNVRLGRYKVDFVWRSQRVVVETDGRQSHATRQAFEIDRARDVELTTTDWKVLRFTWRQLSRQRGWVVEKLGRALGR